MRTGTWWGRCGAACGVAALAMLVAGAAGAGGPESSDAKAEARAAAQMGTAAFKEGRWADAIEALEHAESLVHAPTHLLMIARACAARGELTRAARVYRELDAETPPSAEPAAFSRARADARRELAELVARIPLVTVEVTPKNAPSLVATIDGRRMAADEIGVARALDPGKHTVSASADGLSTAEATITVSDGERRTVSLALVATPRVELSAGAVSVAPVAGRVEPARAGAPAVTEPWQASLRPAAIGALALGVGGTALGTALLSFSSTKQGDADATRTSCSPSCSTDGTARAARLEAASADLHDAGIASLVGGGVFLTGGLVLLVISAHGERVERPRPNVHAFVGPMSAGASGTF